MVVPVIQQAYTDEGTEAIGTHYYTIQPSSGDTWIVHWMYVSVSANCTAITIEDFDGTNIIVGLASDTGGAIARTLSYAEHSNTELRRWLIDNGCYIRIKVILTGNGDVYYTHKSTQIVD